MRIILHFIYKELQSTDTVSITQLLGVSIAKTLSWSQHITRIAENNNRRL